MWLGGGCGGSWPEARSLPRRFYTCLQHRVFLMGAPLPLHPTNGCTIIMSSRSTTNHPCESGPQRRIPSLVPERWVGGGTRLSTHYLTLC
jgi:hypothetical protein